MSIRIGTRVRLKGDHPWAGYSGKFLGYEQVGQFGECPKVRLDGSLGEVFVMEPDQWGPA